MLAALQADNNRALEYVLAGVVFTNLPDDGNTPTSGSIAYKLRFSSQFRQVIEAYSDWKTDMEYPEDMPQGPRASLSDTGGDPCKLKLYSRKHLHFHSATFGI